jgi:hypothetical protein
VYVKIKGPAGVMRFGYFDFSESIREEIRNIVINDMGGYNYESLYVDHEDDDNSEFKAFLKAQQTKIIETYNECKIKDAVRSNFV